MTQKALYFLPVGEAGQMGIFLILTGRQHIN